MLHDWFMSEGDHVSDQQYAVWNKPDTGINEEAMLCERGYKVADKHWGAAYWAALKPVQNRREEICLTCRVPFWCCQLRRVRNITTAAARGVSERESDASASLAVTSTWRIHFNEGLWSCRKFYRVYFNLYFKTSQLRDAGNNYREMFLYLHWAHLSCQQAAQLSEWRL